MKSPSIRSTGDLARHLGLSRWTVSRALNGHGDIAPETAERVRAEAGRLGFAPSLIGRTLRSGTTDWIGVTIPDPEDYFLTAKVKRLKDLLAETGWQVLIQVTEDAAAEQRALARFAAMRCGGVISVASQAGAETFAGLRQRGMAAVAVDPLVPTGVDEVCTDRAGGMRALVVHLNDRGVRCLLCAEIPASRQGYAGQRVVGLRAGARRAGWTSEAIRHWTSDGLSEMRAGAALARAGKIWRDVDAIVALNDRVAFGFLQCLPKGVRVPDDIAVVGYDNSEIATLSRPGLTSIDPRADELMARTADVLLSAIARGRRSKPGGRTVVRPLLVFREST
ncbi:MAG: LacI family DNA-binding transcriptional regulator [Terrimicrobiaceae bacterium]|nr:LacI family DNA-binding transcriptional regulator [Terrimicrobiaceae bacterium]